MLLSSDKPHETVGADAAKPMDMTGENAGTCSRRREPMPEAVMASVMESGYSVSLTAKFPLQYTAAGRG